MFKRTEFDSFMIQARSFLDRADNDPIELRNALIMMMHGMNTLADSCENDLNDQIKKIAEDSRSSIER